MTSPDVRPPDESSANPALLLTRGGRLRLMSGTVALLVALASTYVIPVLEDAQPWARGEEYVPFWNLIGRELMGQGAAASGKQAEVTELTKLAGDGAEPDNGAGSVEHSDPGAPAQPGADDEPPRDGVGGADEGATKADERGQPRAPKPSDPNLKTYPVYTGEVIADADEVHRIEFANQLDYFYSRLALTDLGKPKAVTRVAHWGDSVLGDDGVTHAIRRRLQRRFGDAGHGFHVLGRYNVGYMHRGVRFSDEGGWHKCEIIFNCEDDGLYGYGGVSSHSGGGGTSVWATTKEGLGSQVSRFELWFLNQPEGGKFQIKVDDKVEAVVNTRTETAGSGWRAFDLPDGPHEFEVRAIGEGSARGYGVVLEREGPGVVWDGLALIGSFTQRLDYQEPKHIAEQIKHRDNDLLVFMLGGNDVQREKMDLYRTLQPYEEEYTRVVQKYRAGKPEASCLIMSLTDHGERVGRVGIRTRRIVPKLVATQRKVAEAQGCAFFNTFEAMGGDGSIGRWYYANPRLAGADFSHPTSAGHEVIAELLVRSLMLEYAEFRGRKTGQPLP